MESTWILFEGVVSARSMVQNEKDNCVHVNKSDESEAGRRVSISVFQCLLFETGGCCFMFSQNDAGKFQRQKTKCQSNSLKGSISKQNVRLLKVLTLINYIPTYSKHVTQRVTTLNNQHPFWRNVAFVSPEGKLQVM